MIKKTTVHAHNTDCAITLISFLKVLLLICAGSA
uniref:Uncharacterized protein n=1 Tax=Anguilla anguilla TaxID=7936 RepID=A0A0E9VK47_ANGAN